MPRTSELDKHEEKKKPGFRKRLSNIGHRILSRGASPQPSPSQSSTFLPISGLPSSAHVRPGAHEPSTRRRLLIRVTQVYLRCHRPRVSLAYLPVSSCPSLRLSWSDLRLEVNLATVEASLERSSSRAPDMSLSNMLAIPTFSGAWPAFSRTERGPDIRVDVSSVSQQPGDLTSLSPVVPSSSSSAHHESASPSIVPGPANDHINNASGA
jgi:hypothetical protein